MLVRNAAGQLVGFCHLRFDWEDDDLVLYVYEIQLIADVRQRGLGKFLMQTMELLARRAQMEAVMLTVMGTDAAARSFYLHIGFAEVYSTDEELDTSDDAARGKRYSVMSKVFASHEAVA